MKGVINEPLVLFPNTHLCRRIINKVDKIEQLSVQLKFETSSIDTIFQFVEQGLGGTIVAKTLFDLHATDDLQAHAIQHLLLERETLLVYQKGRLQTPAYKAFMDLLQPALSKHNLSLTTLS